MNSDVITFIQDARFEVTRFREGYDMEEVDRLLDEVSSVVGQDDPEEISLLSNMISNAKFQVTKFREGYDMVQVDDFLDALTEQAKEIANKGLATEGTHLNGTSNSPKPSKKPKPESKFSALNLILDIEFPVTRTDAYAKRDIDNFVGFLKQLSSGTNTYTVAEALQIAEHLSPKSPGLFSSGYDRQHVDAFIARVVGLLKTL